VTFDSAVSILLTLTDPVQAATDRSNPHNSALISWALRPPESGTWVHLAE